MMVSPAHRAETFEVDFVNTVLPCKNKEIFKIPVIDPHYGDFKLYRNAFMPEIFNFFLYFLTDIRSAVNFGSGRAVCMLKADGNVNVVLYQQIQNFII